MDRQTEISKRENYLSWEEYFMALAFLSSERSKDPKTQVGACIVNTDKRIVGLGYNGFANGIKDDDLPWAPKEKLPFVCHAELNAVVNKYTADLKGCKMYVCLFPCSECTKLIIQSGISEVVYYCDKNHHKPDLKASRTMLDKAGVTYRLFPKQVQTLELNFNKLSWGAPAEPNLSEVGMIDATRDNDDDNGGNTT